MSGWNIIIAMYLHVAVLWWTVHIHLFLYKTSQGTTKAYVVLYKTGFKSNLIHVISFNGSWLFVRPPGRQVLAEITRIEVKKQFINERSAVALFTALLLAPSILLDNADSFVRALVYLIWKVCIDSTALRICPNIVGNPRIYALY